jgi:hypothetical protein
MHKQLWQQEVERKLRLGARDQKKKLNTTAVENNGNA